MTDPRHFQKITTIRNFYAVNKYLYRGGQPNSEQFLNLKENGFKTIINLRSGKKTIAREKSIVEELGMKFLNIPLSYFRNPTMDEVNRFIEYTEAAENQPLFVHCFHGVDRTGFIIAMYRIKICQWDFDRAYQEMVECGFHQISVSHYKRALIKLSRT